MGWWLAHLRFVSGDPLGGPAWGVGVANVGAGARRGGRTRGRQAAPERHWICRTLCKRWARSRVTILKRYDRS